MDVEIGFLNCRLSPQTSVTPQILINMDSHWHNPLLTGVACTLVQVQSEHALFIILLRHTVLYLCV